MAQILKREAAKRDLIAQWVWYAENADVDRADQFLAAVEAALDKISLHPNLGQPLTIKLADPKRIRTIPAVAPFESILLFYIPLPDGIDLIRVIHASRNILKLAAEGPFG